MSKILERDRTLALAGVFQAAELVHQAASQGVWSGYAAEQSISSIFKLSADSVEDIFEGPYGVKLGLRTLSQMLAGSDDHVQALKYAVSLLQLEPRFRRRKDMQDQLETQLEAIRQLQGSDEESLIDQQVDALAEVYQDTISNIEPRIIIQGKPVHLKQTRNLNWIRALLLAGLRSAVLWRQTGGNRWSLLFGRKKLLDTAERLLSA